MSKKKSNVPVFSDVPAVQTDDLSDIFGPPPLLNGEDKQAYQSLKGRLNNSVRPANAIEQIWVNDIVNFTWESKRLRELKVKLMTASSWEGIKALLKPMVDHYTCQNLAQKWALNDDEGVECVSKMLDQSFLDEGSINAQVLLIKLDAFERIDELIARNDARRNALINEIDRRREALARRIREATAIEDAEFKEIDGAHQEAAE
ncbi:MAG: hypothetical protein EB015_20700 [Methylocystaceae bacterium]|nr:hypothetical protein [Methylocystaceae bacterium]